MSIRCYVAANRIFVADVETGASTEIAHNQAGGCQLTDFSADGKWLVYTRRGEDLNSEVYLFEIEPRRELNLTDNPFSDMRGILTPDGKQLVFVSDRDNGISHLFVVPLARLAEDPEDPVVKERLKKARSAKKEASAASQPEAIVADAAGIDRRAQQLTRGENGVGSYFLSADGSTIYFISTDERGRGMFSIGIDGQGPQARHRRLRDRYRQLWADQRRQHPDAGLARGDL